MPPRLTSASAAPIVNPMVYYQHARLDASFTALADPTRRAIIDRLARKSELAASQLAAPFTVSLPAVVKHLVLARAGMIEREKTGRAFTAARRGADGKCHALAVIATSASGPNGSIALPLSSRRNNALQAKAHAQAPSKHRWRKSSACRRTRKQ